MNVMARAGIFSFVLAVLFSALVPRSRAADFDLNKCKADFLSGKYEKVIEQAGAAVTARERGEDWALLYAHSLWMTGKYPEARQEIRSAQRFNYYAIRTRLLGYKVYRSAGEVEEAANL